jgi:very-short-patch-repair endonuclease
MALPAPAINTVRHGYEIDVLFVEERVIVELDTWLTHGLRPSFESNRDRDADLLAAGYVTVRVTDERLEHDPEREADRLKAILEARRAA